MNAQNQTDSAAASAQVADARRRLCNLLNLKMPSDNQIWADAVWEIERLRSAIADAKRRKGEICEEFE